MAKLTLSDISSGYLSGTTYTANNTAIEAAVENTLSRDGTAPNQMGAALDMNSYAINNLPNAVANQSPVTLAQASSLLDITAATQASVGALLWPRTAAEISAGVTPTNYYYEPGNVLRYGATGDGATDDTASILSAFTVAHSNAEGKVYFPHGEYSITSTITPGTSAAWDALTVIGDNARITVADGSTAFAYAIYINSTTNMELSISGLEIDCNNLCANGIFVDVRNAETSTLSASGLCRIDARVFDVKKASTITAGAAGIFVKGAFADINVTGEVNSVDRDNHASSGNECQGISITDLVGIARVNARVTGVTTPSASDADADGIAIFGRGAGTGIKTGSARVDGCEVSECRGRHMKVQVSDIVVTRSTFKQTELAMITQSSSIDLQYGNGSIHDNSFYYRENTGGTSPLGSSHAVIESQQTLTDTQMICDIHNNKVFSEVTIPNFVSYTNPSSAKFSTLSVCHNHVRGIEDLTADGEIITRGLIEMDDAAWATNEGVLVKANFNTFSGTSAAKLFGYTGHNGTDDLDDKLHVEFMHNENRGNSGVDVLENLSGSRITKIERLKVFGNINMTMIWTTLDTDLANLPAGTDIIADLAGATFTNGPSNLPASGYVRITTGQAATATWRPIRIEMENGTAAWYRVSNTWRSSPASDGGTGGAASAGAGNQYIEIDVDGTTYKVLHDGTV